MTAAPTNEIASGTKTKVLAAYGQLIEVLFSQGKFPLGVSPTSVPEDISKRAHLDPKNPQQPSEEMESPYGFPGDGWRVVQEDFPFIFCETKSVSSRKCHCG